MSDFFVVDYRNEAGEYVTELVKKADYSVTYINAAGEIVPLEYSDENGIVSREFVEAIFRETDKDGDGVLNGLDLANCVKGLFFGY